MKIYYGVLLLSWAGLAALVHHPLDPVQLGSHPGVNAGVLSVRTADPPAHHSHLQSTVTVGMRGSDVTGPGRSSGRRSPRPRPSPPAARRSRPAQFNVHHGAGYSCAPGRRPSPRQARWRTASCRRSSSGRTRSRCRIAAVELIRGDNRKAW